MPDKKKKKKKPGWKVYLDKQKSYEKSRKTPTTKKDLEKRDLWKKYYEGRITGSKITKRVEKGAPQKAYWEKQAEKERFALRRHGVVSVPIEKKKKKKNKKSSSVKYARDHAGHYRSGS